MSTPFVFDLDGGRACLDFANTLSSSSGDHLNAYADLVAFAEQSHLVNPETAARLLAHAQRHPAEAAATLERGKHLRQSLSGVFTAVANHQRVADADLEVLNAALASSLAKARVLPGVADDDYAWGWARGSDLNTPLWPIVRSAADVLTSEQERPLVRECGAGDCRWLFIDTTKNHTRQWCSMTSCGNREKARRHYQRVRAQRTADPPATPTAAAPRSRRPARQSAAALAGGASATAD
jgi:predicted RNA-binding Zn ribbon-like protein